MEFTFNVILEDETFVIWYTLPLSCVIPVTPEMIRYCPIVKEFVAVRTQEVACVAPVIDADAPDVVFRLNPISRLPLLEARLNEEIDPYDETAELKAL